MGRARRLGEATRGAAGVSAAASVVVALGLAPLAIAGPAQALDADKAISQYTLTTWQTEDGLPQDSLTAIVQGPGGALWIGTPSGLVRFDGTSFARVPTSEQSSADRYITGLVATADGTIWASTRESLFEHSPNGVRRYGVEAGLPPGGALGLIDAGGGALYVASTRGVIRFASGRGELLRTAEGEPLDQNVIALVNGGGGRLLVGTDNGLALLDRRGTRWLRRADGLPSDLVTALVEERSGAVWIGTALGLVRLAGGRVERPAAAKALGSIWIRSLAQDRDGNLWVGARGGGAFRIRGDRLDPLSAATGLPNDLVRQIHEDRDGALWFATAGGLARLRDGPVTTWSSAQGLSVPFLWAVDEDPNGELWIGTSGGGVARLTPDGPRPAPFDDPGLSGTEIRAFATDRNGRLWIGTGGNGLAYVENGRVRWVESNGRPGSLWVSSLLEDRRGRLWAGTSAGVERIESGRSVALHRLERDGAAIQVRALAEDSLGTLWVGYANGLASFDGEKLSAVQGAEPLATARIHCILPEASGALWLATDGGLARYEGGRLERWTTREGLPIDMLYWLIDDGRGTFWISSDVGILALPRSQIEELRRGDRTRLEPLVLGKSDGLRANECNSGHPAGVARRDGTFCFPTTDGLACAYPEKLNSITAPPPVALNEAYVDGGARSDLIAARAVELPSGARRLEFRYAATALVAAEKVTFRYRLVGFDPGWVEAGATRAAQFTGLQPGAYRFEVEARRAGGAWSESARSAPFTVEPAFHQTGTFYVLVAAVAALFGSAIYRLRTGQLRARARSLATLVVERTQELEHANEELQRLSLADGLTRIANRRHFDHRLDAEWRRAIRHGAPVSLVLADIDRFKAFNDRYGHLAGDDCLRAVTAAVAGCVHRAEDLVARYGGEELAILLPGTTTGDALLLAERIRVAVEALDRRHEGSEEGRVTLSLGVATAVPEQHSRPESLVAAADRAMYRAKAAGRNRVES